MRLPDWCTDGRPCWCRMLLILWTIVVAALPKAALGSASAHAEIAISTAVLTRAMDYPLGPVSFLSRRGELSGSRRKSGATAVAIRRFAPAGMRLPASGSPVRPLPRTTRLGGEYQAGGQN